MQVGERWGYREKIGDSDCPLIPAEVIQFGPLRSQKVRVRMLGGEYPGLDQWVPKVRLRVLWVDADAWLRDERLLQEVRAASLDAVDSLEHNAAFIAVYPYPVPDGILIGYGHSEGASVRIADLDTIARDLGWEPKELLGEPLAFINRHGEYIAPWPVAQRIAERVAERYGELVLAEVAKRERELQERAIHGWDFSWGRGQDFYVPPEKCVEQLRKEQPVLDLVRRWCDSSLVERFDEVAALSAEVVRLRKMVEDAAKNFEAHDLRYEARRLRKAMNTQEG